MKASHLATAILLVLAAAASRLIPHWPNFTPVMAIALFAGLAISNRWLAAVVPVAAMVLSDVMLGLVFGPDYGIHSTQLVVYACMIGVVPIGNLMKGASALTISLGAGTLVACAFFLITNAAVWAFGTLYPHTFDGLLTSYAAGLAFYKDSGNFFLNSVVSTWVYSGALVVIYRSATQLKTKEAH